MCTALPPLTESSSATRFAGLSAAVFFALVRDEPGTVVAAARYAGESRCTPDPKPGIAAPNSEASAAARS
jgi:hypothetical protein